jgi:hypothetical protein
MFIGERQPEAAARLLLIRFDFHGTRGMEYKMVALTILN